jgi:hypothetical protein
MPLRTPPSQDLLELMRWREVCAGVSRWRGPGRCRRVAVVAATGRCTRRSQARGTGHDQVCASHERDQCRPARFFGDSRQQTSAHQERLTAPGRTHNNDPPFITSTNPPAVVVTRAGRRHVTRLYAELQRGRDTACRPSLEGSRTHTSTGTSIIFQDRQIHRENLTGGS